ncbi:hypothetical protein MPSEU_000043600 [Mayamaea pseudoterrestris]|nr:hypothetical protein MPSEU_000043600 [Mayamaea pseudoterrestris]
MSIVQQIKENDPELKEIRLAEDPLAYAPTVAELCDALASNTEINHVRIDRDFLPCMNDEDIQPFFEALSKIPSLLDAQIWHASVQVSILAAFIKATKQLEHLQFGCLELEGEENDFSLINEAIQGHPTLKSFTMSDFSLNNESISMDETIAVLGTIPNLQSVKLEVSNRRRASVVGPTRAAQKVQVTLSGAGLAKLLSESKSIQKLHLNRLNLDSTDFGVLAEAIKTAPCLREFALPHCNLDDGGCVKIAEAIGQNKTLEKIDLSCNKLTDEGCVTLASALEGNKSVKFLRLWGNVKISNNGFDSIREMLEQNCVLERVPLMTGGTYGVATIDPLQAGRSGKAA